MGGVERSLPEPLPQVLAQRAVGFHIAQNVWPLPWPFSAPIPTPSFQTRGLLNTIGAEYISLDMVLIIHLCSISETVAGLSDGVE